MKNNESDKAQPAPTAREFPNGFTSWHETHFEVVQFITGILSGRFEDNDNEVMKTQYAVGHGGLYELAESWTDEFETLNKDREWDGEFFDEIEAFCDKKNKPTSSGE